ncbi:hypothetical protein [Coleofasciculus sp. H7-2]
MSPLFLMLGTVGYRVNAIANRQFAQPIVASHQPSEAINGT